MTNQGIRRSLRRQLLKLTSPGNPSFRARQAGFFVGFFPLSFQEAAVFSFGLDTCLSSLRALSHLLEPKRQRNAPSSARTSRLNSSAATSDTRS